MKKCNNCESKLLSIILRAIHCIIVRYVCWMHASNVCSTKNSLNVVETSCNGYIPISFGSDRKQNTNRDKQTWHISRKFKTERKQKRNSYIQIKYMYKHADDGAKRVYMDWMSCKVDSISSVSALHFSFSATSSSREMLDEQSFGKHGRELVSRVRGQTSAANQFDAHGGCTVPTPCQIWRTKWHARKTCKRHRRKRTTNLTKKRKEEFSKINFGWERKTKEEKSPVTKESQFGGSIKGYAPSRRSTSFCSFCTDRSANSARVSACSGTMHSMYNLQAWIVFQHQSHKILPITADFWMHLWTEHQSCAKIMNLERQICPPYLHKHKCSKMTKIFAWELF